MEQYIKKSALVTEIKRRIGEINQFGIKLSYEGGLIDAYKIILSSLDTLEVKEVDLKQETLCDKCKKAQPSHSCQDITALGRCALEKQEEQKSSWSDEDNAVLDALIRVLEGKEDIYVSPHLAAECLKSLKDRVQPQPKQEWSVEDRSKIQRICMYLNEVKKYCADITEVRECIDWLKALIPQNT
jgi:hypothetical protein